MDFIVHLRLKLFDPTLLILILLAQGMNRPSLYDLALALSLLAFGGGLVFARFLERWL